MFAVSLSLLINLNDYSRYVIPIPHFSSFSRVITSIWLLNEYLRWVEPFGTAFRHSDSILISYSCFCVHGNEVSVFVKEIDSVQRIMTCIPIARQRLGKHSPAETNARNNRTSITRERISKHAPLTVEAVFSAAWSCEVVVKKNSIEQYIEQ
jgi:hypothetical protein